MEVDFVRQRSGIALVTALVFLVFITILGLAFQTVVQTDLHFVAEQQANAQAYYLAKAGFEYYLRKGPFVEPIRIPPGDSRHICVMNQRPVSGDLEFTGKVLNGTHRTVASRTIVFPNGALDHWFEK